VYESGSFSEMPVRRRAVSTKVFLQIDGGPHMHHYVYNLPPESTISWTIQRIAGNCGRLPSVAEFRNGAVHHLHEKRPAVAQAAPPFRMTSSLLEQREAIGAAAYRDRERNLSMRGSTSAPTGNDHAATKRVGVRPVAPQEAALSGRGTHFT